MKNWLAFGAVALFITALPCTTFAKGDAAQQEAATAQDHAVFAKKADSLKMTHAHLHHVINCLVGSKGAAFDAKAFDPCKGMGNGALNDSAKNTRMHSLLEQALMTAEVGLKSNNLKMAHQAAGKTAELLKAASSAK
ncbi:MAG: hypothetical protein ACRER1_06920 [Gammaproteobacteria bacterium]